MENRLFHLICTCSLVLPLITGSSQEPVHQCIPTVTVPRNTVWRASPMQPLKINCSVTIDSPCRNMPVLWCKVDDGNDCKHLNQSSHIITEWRNITGGQGISFLIFRNLSASDSGLYRCKIVSQVSIVSHNINVTVTDFVPPIDNMDNQIETNQNKSNNSTNDTESWQELWHYVSICSGFLLVVATVILGSLLIIRCQRSKKSRKERTAQSTATQVANPPQPIIINISYQQGNTNSLPPQLSPCSTYDIPPVRSSSHRDRPSAGSRLANQPAPGRRCDQGNVKEKEEDSPLIYASLNHKAVLRGGPIKVSHSELESSEYAAIKLT